MHGAQDRRDAQHGTEQLLGMPSSSAGSVSGLATQSSSATARAQVDAPAARIRALSQTPSAPVAARHGAAPAR